MSKHSLLERFIILFSFAVSLIIIFNYSILLGYLVSFTENYVSTDDGIVKPNKLFILKFILIFFIGFGFLISSIILFNLHKKAFNLIQSILNFDKLKVTFLSDPLIGKSKLPKYTLVLTTIAGISLQLKYILFKDTLEETFAEYVCTLLFLVSTIILIMSIKKLKYNLIDRKDKRIIKLWLLFCSISLLFIFFEEISWGQHLFHWEATGIFKENNFQHETNLHNFINPFFRFIYPISGMGLFTILYLLWFFYNGTKPTWLQIVLPHTSLFPITFIMACASFMGHSETFEEMLSFFILFYCLRIYVYLNKNKYLNNPV